MQELIAASAKVFEVLLETSSSGPQIKLFQRFSNVRDTINAAVYEIGIDDQDLAPNVSPAKDEVIAFIKTQLQTFLPKDVTLQRAASNCTNFSGRYINSIHRSQTRILSSS